MSDPSPVTLAVNSATITDIPLLAAAHLLGQEAVVDARGGRLDTLLRGRGAPVEETFSADLEASDTRVDVATANDRFIGYGVTRLRELRSGERIAVVTDLWVHPDARGVGAGNALMNRAVDFARGNDCVGIDARALPGDRSTKNFFESFGLVARAIEVHQTL